MLIDDAIARLKKFRYMWNEGDIIDEDSRLTADDLDLIIRAAEAGVKTVQIPGHVDGNSIAS